MGGCVLIETNNDCVDDDSRQEEKKEKYEAEPPEDSLPLVLPEVAKHNNAEEQADDGACQVSHVGDSRVDTGHKPVVDGYPCVHTGQEEEGEEPEGRELHFSPVEDDIGQVGGDQGVDAARGSGQVHVRVGDGGGQRPGCHTRHIDEEYPPPPVAKKALLLDTGWLGTNRIVVTTHCSSIFWEWR